MQLQHALQRNTARNVGDALTTTATSSSVMRQSMAAHRHACNSKELAATGSKLAAN
jgi:hypothetical protein